MITPNELLQRIADMNSVEGSTVVAEEMRIYKQQVTPDEYAGLQKALSQRLNQLADQFEREQEEMTIMLKSL